MKNHLVGITALMALAYSAGPAAAQTTASSYQFAVTTGLVGLMPSTQTAQLNVLNLAAPAAGGTAASCPIDLEFRDAQNSVRKSLQVANLTAGTAASLTFNLTDMPAGTVVFRLDIRGVVRSNPAVTAPIASGASPLFPIVGCALLTTLELFDTTTGVTQTFTSDTRPFAYPAATALNSAH